MPFYQDYRLAAIPTAIGAIWGAYQAYQLASFIQLYFLRKSTLKRYLKPNPSGEPAWALITGATDGIGRGFAEELCQQGFNVIVHGRNPEKLENERKKLLSRWPERSVRTLCIDAANEDGNVEALEKAAAEYRLLDLRILVNNVGGTGRMVSSVPLHQRTAEESRFFVDMNLRFPTEITRILLPQLRDNTPSLILNLSSVTANFGIPYLSIYSAAKGYNQSFSRCLTAEMKAEGVDVEVIGLVVSAVATDHYTRPQSMFVPNSRKFAQAALGVVGCGRTIVVPYWGHRVQSWLLELMPTKIKESLMVDAGKTEKKNEESGATDVKAQKSE
ncbi:Very-long-chain 3-oxoacyl-CoA reductase [Cercospora beticola]|uniref:Very-long-chain 3-oxoacyl-CoA reductase n=1 Tax=Cercospora beticola TaxID=122368 RepID=A0A2G5I806_CERBT|nr:Very-long-chain 3-oxoacyl-CoA reductase [Cercospora beticola]PIB00931.1 Very-long-chain 3-oxoacyl-CoA reductase [Cercospora beticola]WPA97274.1 hypothetical protein RHO25_001883 [Cercospora beticola]